MKFRKMSRYEIFKYDLKKCGFMYAVLWYFDLPYVFDYSRCKALKQISDKAFDWCNSKLIRKTPAGSKLSPFEYTEYYPPQDTMII